MKRLDAIETLIILKLVGDFDDIPIKIPTGILRYLTSQF